MLAGPLGSSRKPHAFEHDLECHDSFSSGLCRDTETLPVGGPEMLGKSASALGASRRSLAEGRGWMSQPSFKKRQFCLANVHDQSDASATDLKPRVEFKNAVVAQEWSRGHSPSARKIPQCTRHLLCLDTRGPRTFLLCQSVEMHPRKDRQRKYMRRDTKFHHATQIHALGSLFGQIADL